MGLRDLLLGSYSKRELKKVEPIKQKVLSHEDEMKKLSDEELRAKTDEFKERLKTGETLDDILPEAFAVCREAADRVLGMRPYPVQIIGGIVLHEGRIAEMKTGEGKTLVATLPAYLNALTGKGVHIVTVNDYLAKRDSEWMGKLYRFLGLTVGLITHDIEGEDRRAAYAADITYCTNNELGFDYLRDNMVTYKEERVQRGHSFAIVDEVDSILIDEARTPLIISGQGEKSTDLYKRADSLAKSLKMTKVKNLNSKEEAEEQVEEDGDYIVDEKAKTATLTASGVKKAEAFFGLENLNDPENITIAHHVNQAIKAHGIMHRDIDYVVKDGEVIIVDEFTGRLMFGRRYNEGLHQAIEAKENVKIAHESKTLATITFQNLFRMYNKLSGMTGTALTESQEFAEIYKLDVVEIPTNKPMARIDNPDIVYKTEAAKFNAVIEDIAARHEKGQPVLVGTISIEKSEHLSKLLKKKGIKHNVLNAKNHRQEAEIIAQAGKFGAVTIATNMAGRGTDIMLGGNAEYMAKAAMKKQGFEDEMIAEATGFAETDNEEILNARKTFSELNAKFKEEIQPEAEKVREAGGLCIIGTERHESRRIDNQLRGRSGRQGDPGESRFYISLEDDLMRLFGGERIYRVMETLKVDDNVPLEMKMLSNSIEGAQEKIEYRNFSIRKNVLDYDDVMNVQRTIIYDQRNKVIDGDDITGTVKGMVKDTIKEICTHYLSADIAEEWNFKGLKAEISSWLEVGDALDYSNEELNKLERDDVVETIEKIAFKKYDEREEEFGSELMREVERVVLLRSVDTHWMEHIDAMDQLREGIHLRSYGQHDPVVAYRNEGYDMFNAMTESIKEDTTKRILNVRLRQNQQLERERVAKETGASGADDGSVKKEPIRKAKKPGRNDPCPCGSGKKYKKCCGRDE
ncbi:MAG: preprotein translocase subunit SecA [Acutalibacteraceae bacterium]|nr:preprotein translocase subunit SecA [Acutalibacteraceae bacterium]